MNFNINNKFILPCLYYAELKKLTPKRQVPQISFAQTIKDKSLHANGVLTL